MEVVEEEEEEGTAEDEGVETTAEEEGVILTATTIAGETATTIRGDGRDHRRGAILRDLVLANLHPLYQIHFVNSIFDSNRNSKIRPATLAFCTSSWIVFSSRDMDAGYASHSIEMQTG